MTKELEEIQNMISEMDYASDKLGETLYDAIEESDNFSYDMGKGIANIIMLCETGRDFSMVNDAVCAICGYGIATLLERIRAHDADPEFQWESI